MSLYKNIKIITSVNNKRVVSGVYTGDESFPILIEFYQDNIKKGATLAIVKERKFGSKQQTELSRGLYQLRIYKIENEKPCEEPVVYDELVMAGEKYPVRIRKRQTAMHGMTGTEIHVESPELSIDNDGLFYRINSSEPQLKKIKYWVPMQGDKNIRFFVANASPDEIDFPKEQNDCLEIQVMN